MTSTTRKRNMITILSIISENSTTEAVNIPSSYLSENSNNTSISTNPTQILSNYANDIQDILKTFNHIKKIGDNQSLTIDKKYFYTNQKLNIPMQKILVIIK